MNIKAPFVFTNEQIRSTFNEKNLAAMSEQIREEPEMKTNIEALRTPEERFAVACMESPTGLTCIAR